MTATKTFALGIVSLLAISALMVVTGATQAAKPKEEKSPIWKGCKGELFLKGGKCQTISWGTLTFENAEIGNVTCKKSDAGNIWNPKEVPNESGHDEVVLLDFYECTSSEERCPGVSIKALNLPWQTALFNNGTGGVYDRIEGIELEVTCPPKPAFIEKGTLRPTMVNGNPLYENFTAAAGSLTSPYGPVTVTGKDKNQGFENQERLKV
jgi:hypothetical protein